MATQEIKNFLQKSAIGSIEIFPGVQEYLGRLSQRYEIRLATSRLPNAKEAALSWLEKTRRNG